VKVTDLMSDAALFKWASKAAITFIMGEDVVCNMLIPCGDLLLERARQFEDLEAKEAQ